MSDPAPRRTDIHVFPQAGDAADADRQWYWHIKADNGEIIGAACRGESTPLNAEQQVTILALALENGAVPSHAQDAAGEWRWEVREDDELLGRSSEGFKARAGSKNNFRLLWDRLTGPYRFDYADADEAS